MAEGSESQSLYARVLMLFFNTFGKDQHAQDFLKHLKKGIDTSHVFQYQTHTSLAFIAIVGTQKIKLLWKRGVV